MTKASESFRGFPPEAFTFLSGLSQNNNKAWFDAHRDVYDGAIVVPALRFVDAMGTAIKKFAPSVTPEPKVGGSLFRIHRDTRFSSEKSPYKTHVGIRLRDGDTAKSAKCRGPLFYVEFDATRLRLGVGVKEFEGGTLDAYRRAVAHTKGAKELGDIVRYAERRSHEIFGDKLIRVPPTYTKQSDNELLKRKGIFIREQMPLPGEIHGPEFIGYCARWFEPYAPLFDLLRKIAGER